MINSGSPYGWLFLAALGMGIFLSSLVRKDRGFFWIIAGFSLFLLSLGGAFIITDFISPHFIKEKLLLYFLPLTLLFSLISYRLALLIPFLILSASLIPIVWGSSSIFTLERGIYPVKITCYPRTALGRSYNVVYADGRESTLSGAGDYLQIQKIDWQDFLFLVPSKEIPMGFTPWLKENLSVNDIPLLPLTLEQSHFPDRPGIIRKMYLMGPVEEDLFYSWWLTKDRQGNLYFTSLNPAVLD